MKSKLRFPIRRSSQEVKLAASFPNQTFFDYSAAITFRPIAYVLTLLYFGYFVTFVSYELRTVSGIAKNYLFDRTPLQAIGLAFHLAVIYAVAGSRAALLRLNLMFLPIVLTVSIVVQSLSANFFTLTNLRPMFVTEWSGLLEGIKQCSYSFLGFELILFYIAFMDRPQDAPKAAVYGLAPVIPLYLFIYMMVIGVFGQEAAANIEFPSIEMAKEVTVPGQFFERFESVFLTIWFMTIFNTTAMAYDVAVTALTSLSKKIRRQTAVFVLAPFIYFAAMAPRNYQEVIALGEWLSLAGLFQAMVIPGVLFLIMKIRGLGHER